MTYYYLLLLELLVQYTCGTCSTVIFLLSLENKQTLLLCCSIDRSDLCVYALWPHIILYQYVSYQDCNKYQYQYCCNCNNRRTVHDCCFNNSRHSQLTTFFFPVKTGFVSVFQFHYQIVFVALVLVCQCLDTVHLAWIVQFIKRQQFSTKFFAVETRSPFQCCCYNCIH